MTLGPITHSLVCERGVGPGERIVADVKLARPVKVVVDCGNGIAGASAPGILRALGCEVVELFSEVDGNFPNHHPDPSKPDNLRDLIAALRDTGFLTYEGDRIGAANTAVVVTGGALGDNAGNQGSTVARFAAALAPHGLGTVLAGRDCIGVMPTGASCGVSGASSVTTCFTPCWSMSGWTLLSGPTMIMGRVS